jgi:hypothetical protein
MAVTTTKLPNTAIGITYSVITDSSSDWPSVSNDVYFYDKATDLPYYKNSSGTVVSLFEEGGGGGSTIYTSDGTLTGNRIVDLNSNTLKFEDGQTYIDSGSFNPLVINRKGSGTLGNGIDFNAYNSSNAETNFARIIQVATDVTAGSEDGGLWLRTMIGGTLRTPVRLDNRELLIDATNFTDNSFRVVDGSTECLKVTTSKQTYIESGSFNPLVINRKGLGNQGNGIDFNAYNSSNAEHNFARVIQVATNNTAGSEDGGLWLRVSDGGSITTKLTIGADTSSFEDKLICKAGLEVKGLNTSYGGFPLKVVNGSNVSLLEVRNNGAFIVGGSAIIGTEDISLQGDTLITKKLELSTTTDGFLMPRLTTAQKNAISSPDTNLMVFDTDLSSLQRYNGSAWVALADGYGILGIASTGGDYTYYSTYTLAMTAAVAGETVEQFGNITETSNVTITIKDGVSINMNGYTYTTDGSTVGAFYHDDNGYEQTRFQNGTVKHINTGGVSNALSIGGESHMDCTGLIVISDGAYCLNFNTDGVQKGRLIGGSYIHTGGSGWNHIIEGNVYGAYFNTGDGAVRITGGSLDNCRIDGSVFLINAGIISNSRVIGGSYSHAISNEGTVFNTYASSALFRGISNSTNGIVENSTGISNASDGIYSAAGTINNSRGKSTASYGIYLSNVNAYANGCIAESSAAAAIRLNAGKLYNCKAICTFNDP